VRAAHHLLLFATGMMADPSEGRRNQNVRTIGVVCIAILGIYVYFSSANNAGRREAELTKVKGTVVVAKLKRSQDRKLLKYRDLACDLKINSAHGISRPAIEREAYHSDVGVDDPFSPSCQVIHNYEESVFLKKAEIYKEEVKRKETEVTRLCDAPVLA